MIKLINELRKKENIINTRSSGGYGASHPYKEKEIKPGYGIINPASKKETKKEIRPVKISKAFKKRKV